jgi:hypothetical protein
LEKGFRAETNIFYELKNLGYEPVGKSLNPDKYANPESTYKAWVGSKGIDGIYVDKKGNYVIVESKATGGIKPGDPSGCVKELCLMKNGERQMSEAWLEDRLKTMVPDKTERDKIIAGLATGKTKKIYAKTDEFGTAYNEIDDVIGNDKEVIIGKKWTP